MHFSCNTSVMTFKLSFAETKTGRSLVLLHFCVTRQNLCGLIILVSQYQHLPYVSAYVCAMVQNYMPETAMSLVLDSTQCTRACTLIPCCSKAIL